MKYVFAISLLVAALAWGTVFGFTVTKYKAKEKECAALGGVPLTYQITVVGCVRASSVIKLEE